jgi:hypothetical protein
MQQELDSGRHRGSSRCLYRTPTAPLDLVGARKDPQSGRIFGCPSARSAMESSANAYRTHSDFRPIKSIQINQPDKQEDDSDARPGLGRALVRPRRRRARS